MGRARRTNTPETNHAMKCGAMSWRYMSHAATGRTMSTSRFMRTQMVLSTLRSTDPHRFPPSSSARRTIGEPETRRARAEGTSLEEGRVDHPRAVEVGDPTVVRARTRRARQTAERSPGSRNVRTRATTSGVAAEKNSVSRFERMIGRFDRIVLGRSERLIVSAPIRSGRVRSLVARYFHASSVQRPAPDIPARWRHSAPRADAADAPRVRLRAIDHVLVRGDALLRAPALRVARVFVVSSRRLPATHVVLLSSLAPRPAQHQPRRPRHHLLRPRRPRRGPPPRGWLRRRHHRRH